MCGIDKANTTHSTFIFPFYISFIASGTEIHCHNHRFIRFPFYNFMFDTDIRNSRLLSTVRKPQNLCFFWLLPYIGGYCVQTVNIYSCCMSFVFHCCWYLFTVSNWFFLLASKHYEIEIITVPMLTHNGVKRSIFKVFIILFLSEALIFTECISDFKELPLSFPNDLLQKEYIEQRKNNDF